MSILRLEVQQWADHHTRCPWVTVVGATQLQPNQPLSSPETAAFQPIFNFSSSGGFSNYFPAPDYQRKAVEQYLSKEHLPFDSYFYNGSASSIGAGGGRYNCAGRGSPDVSALGTNFTTVNSGAIDNTGGGTSAATPIFASIIWKLNAERIATGKKTLGFINPALYANPQVLRDVLEGSNPGCGTSGFTATKG